MIDKVRFSPIPIADVIASEYENQDIENRIAKDERKLVNFVKMIQRQTRERKFSEKNEVEHAIEI